MRSRSLVGNAAAGLRSLAGSEFTEYTHLGEAARRHAIDRMIENAKLMAANAVSMMLRWPKTARAHGFRRGP